MNDDDTMVATRQKSGRRTQREIAEALRLEAQQARTEAIEEGKRLRKRAAELESDATRLEAAARARESKQRRLEAGRVRPMIVRELARLAATADVAAIDVARRILLTLDDADRLVAVELLGVTVPEQARVAAESGQLAG